MWTFIGHCVYEKTLSLSTLLSLWCDSPLCHSQCFMRSHISKLWILHCCTLAVQYCRGLISKRVFSACHQCVLLSWKLGLYKITYWLFWCCRCRQSVWVMYGSLYVCVALYMYLSVCLHVCVSLCGSVYLCMTSLQCPCPQTAINPAGFAGVIAEVKGQH